MRTGVTVIRLIWYIIRTALAIALAVALFVFAFYTAMGLANMYIITTEGMKKRADEALSGAVDAELVEYFSPEWLENDVLILSGKYLNYTVKNYNYKIKVEWMWALPWDNEGTVTFSERVADIEGELIAEKKIEGQTTGLTPPEWDDFRYKATLEKDEKGRFYISKLEKLERLEQEEYTSMPTIGPDTTMTPIVTPSPSPTFDIVS